MSVYNQASLTLPCLGGWRYACTIHKVNLLLPKEPYGHRADFSVVLLYALIESQSGMFTSDSIKTLFMLLCGQPLTDYITSTTITQRSTNPLFQEDPSPAEAVTDKPFKTLSNSVSNGGLKALEIKYGIANGLQKRISRFRPIYCWSYYTYLLLW